MHTSVRVCVCATTSATLEIGADEGRRVSTEKRDTHSALLALEIAVGPIKKVALVKKIETEKERRTVLFIFFFIQSALGFPFYNRNNKTKK